MEQILANEKWISSKSYNHSKFRIDYTQKCLGHDLGQSINILGLLPNIKYSNNHKKSLNSNEKIFHEDFLKVTTDQKLPKIPILTISQTGDIKLAF